MLTYSYQKNMYDQWTNFPSMRLIKNMIIIFWRHLSSNSTYPWKHDLVERTQLSWIRVPSHTWVPSFSRVTCQGQSPCPAVKLSYSAVTAAGLSPHLRSWHCILRTSLLEHSDNSNPPDSRDSNWNRELIIQMSLVIVKPGKYVYSEEFFTGNKNIT